MWKDKGGPLLDATWKLEQWIVERSNWKRNNSCEISVSYEWDGQPEDAAALSSSNLPILSIPGG